MGLSVLITAPGASPADHADVTAWPGLLAVLGFSMKHLCFGNAFLAYAGEATRPFYILHQNQCTRS